MKLKQLIEARKTIMQYAKEKIPAPTAYKLIKFLKHTDTDELFLNEKLREIIIRYARKDEGGEYIFDENKGICLKPDYIEDARKEITELENVEIEIPFRFSLEEFTWLKISMSEIYTLDGLIEE